MLGSAPLRMGSLNLLISSFSGLHDCWPKSINNYEADEEAFRLNVKAHRLPFSLNIAICRVSPLSNDLPPADGLLLLQLDGGFILTPRS